MIHLIWSAINLFILLFYIYLLFALIAKGRQLFKNRLKGLYMLMLILGSVQIIDAANNKNKQEYIVLKEEADLQQPTQLKEIVLEEGDTFDIRIYLACSEGSAEHTPVKVSSSLSGLVLGYEFELTSLQAKCFGADHKTGCTAKGILQWELFGMPLYRQVKTYQAMVL